MIVLRLFYIGLFFYHGAFGLLRHNIFKTTLFSNMQQILRDSDDPSFIDVYAVPSSDIPKASAKEILLRGDISNKAEINECVLQVL